MEKLLEQLNRTERRIALYETILFVLFLAITMIAILAITISE